MKKIKTVIKRIILIILVVFLALIGIGILVDKGILKTTPDKPEVTIEYKPQGLPSQIDEEEIPDTSYFESFEDALKAANKKSVEDAYQNHVDEVIERIENDNYVIIYFKAIKDNARECITLAKFKKKSINGVEKYAFLTSVVLQINYNIILHFIYQLFPLLSDAIGILNEGKCADYLKPLKLICRWKILKNQADSPPDKY